MVTKSPQTTLRTRHVTLACLAIAVVTVVMGAACTPVSIPRVAPLPANAVRVFGKAEIIAGLDTMFAILERVHPNIYATSPRDSFERARQAFSTSLPDSASRPDYYLGFARLVALVGDGHTTIAIPEEERRQDRSATSRVFPLGVERDNHDSLRITSRIGSLPVDLVPGDRLLSVNGLGADSLLRDFMGEVSGETEPRRARAATQAFAALLWLHRIRAPFQLVTKDRDGATHDVAVSGIAYDSSSIVARETRGAINVRSSEIHYLTYRRLDDGIGYLNFSLMFGSEKEADSVFRQIAEDSLRALVIDLRNNPGGSTGVGETVLNHFTDMPYRTASRKEWRISDEYRSFFRSAFNRPLRWLHPEYLIPALRPVYTGPAGKTLTIEAPAHRHERAEPHFSGPVCVLIGPGTFSSAVEVADAIKTYHLATLIGEPTGGMPNSFGEVFWLRLPITGFVLNVSTARFVRASGDSSTAGPVWPDIEIHRTAEDIANGRDPILDRARRCGKT